MIFFYLLKAIFTYPNKIFLFKKNVSYKDKDFLIIKNNSITLLSNLILKEIDIVLMQIKKEKEKRNIDNDRNYTFNIESFFSEKILREIENSLKNAELINYISNHFEYKIKFSQFQIRYNYFNSFSPSEYGPKMWHRDNDSLFNQLKFFLVLNDLTDDSGGHFYFIPQKIIPGCKKIYSSYSDKENFSKADKNSRIKNIDIEEKYKFKDNVIKYGADKSGALVLDTNDTYHRGGYIKNKNSYRILLQVIYEPVYLSLSNYSKFYNNNFIYRYSKIFLLGLKNRLRSGI